MITNQDKIWDYFQNQGIESFDAAKPRYNHLIREIARRSSGATPRVLNIGVGSGHFELTAREQGWHVESLDPGERAVERLTEMGLTAHQGYIEQMPFEAGSFDFIVASEVIEHLSDEQRTQGLQEIARVLRPGGWFLGTVPFNENLEASQVVCPCCGTLFHRWGHQKSFTLESMRDVLAAHLSVQSVQTAVFVDLASRSLFGKLKGLARLSLARLGASISLPSILFSAQKQ